MKALKEGALWFREYQDIHAGKGNRDKAQRNAYRAASLEAVLSGIETKEAAE